MPWRTRNSALSFDDYTRVLEQLHTSTLRPMSPRSVLSVSVKSHCRGIEFRPHLEVAERVAAFLTAEQRRAVGRGTWPQRELLAAATGTPLREIDRLIQNFDEVNEVASQYLRLGLWGRVKWLIRLTREDAVVGWLEGRRRPSGPSSRRSDDRG